MHLSFGCREPAAPLSLSLSLSHACDPAVTGRPSLLFASSHLDEGRRQHVLGRSVALQLRNGEELQAHQVARLQYVHDDLEAGGRGEFQGSDGLNWH